jgi:hypothetical protein
VRTSRKKTALSAVGLFLGVSLLGAAGVQAANALTLEDDPATAEQVVTEEALVAPDSEAAVPEETPVVPEEEVVPEEDVTEESAAPQGFSTQTAKNDGEQGQDTCPDGGGWLKIEPIDALTYEYTAPSGQLIAEVCYKAANDVIYIDIEDAASYEFVSTVTNKNGELQQISHVSVRLITEEPTCVDDPVYAYTFDPATGSGVITVTGGEEGEELCEPLAVRAASWTYDTPASGSPSWPQTLNGYNDTTVDAIGEFNYGPPQLEDCRQYDVYASFGGFDELELPTYLNGSHDPFEPAFLHETLNGFGPNPTYSFTSSEGCNPTSTEIEPDGPIKNDVCGIANDSFTLPGAQPNELESITPEGTYTADELPTEDGTVVVTFVPADGYEVKDDPNAEYEVDENGNAVWILVFTDEPCSTVIVKPAVQHVEVCGVDNDTVTTPGTAVENAEGITETEEFYYVIDPDGTDTPGTITVLAIPKDGFTVAEPGEGDTYVIDGGGNASWTFVDDDAACPPPGLAFTNGSDPMPAVGLASSLLALGSLMVAGMFLLRRMNVV